MIKYVPSARISGLGRKVPIGLVYLLGSIPGIYLLLAGIFGMLGLDPMKTMELESGLLSLQFLLASLSITPILRLGRINLVRFRRPLGLLSFGYLVLHVVVWMMLDLELHWGEIWRELTGRIYLIVGTVAAISMLLLASTSSGRAISKIGPARWRRLHALAYGAVILGAVHFALSDTLWSGETAIYLIAAIGLVAIRLTWLRYSR